MTSRPARAGSGRRLVDRMVDACPDVLSITTPGGVVRYASGAARRVLGYEPESMVGRHLHEFLHPDDLGVFLRVTDGSAPGGPAVASLHRWLRADGATVWLESLVQVTAGEAQGEGPVVVISSRDVSGRLQTERRLLTAEQRARRLADAMDEGLVVLDSEGRVVSVNLSGERILGRMAAQLVGRVTADVVALHDESGEPLPHEVRPGTHVLLTGAEEQRVLGIRRPDGSTVWVRSRAVPLTSAGEPESQQVAVIFREAEQPGGSERDADAVGLLTARELEVLVLMSQGLDPRRVAAALHISVHTARGHVKSILAKLDAHSQLEAVVLANRRGILRLEESAPGA